MHLLILSLVTTIFASFASTAKSQSADTVLSQNLNPDDLRHPDDLQHDETLIDDRQRPKKLKIEQSAVKKTLKKKNKTGGSAIK